MDAVRLGRQIRALRRHRSWRQLDLADRAHVSRAFVARIEGGGAGRVSAEKLERMAGALGARLELRLSWNGEALDRLMDEGHAGLVERLVRFLVRHHWLAVPEVSFNVRGERGSVDIIGFHPATRAVLVVEVKSVVPDVQATLMTLDRKARLAPRLARERGWEAASVTQLLLIGESRTARRRIAAHEATFRSSFPCRGQDARRWLADPRVPGPTGALLFLSGAHELSTRHRIQSDSSSVAHQTSR
jgi:transcriptional regulator with XRE-family HTH domain